VRKITFLTLFFVLVAVSLAIFLIQRDNEAVTQPSIEQRYIIGKLEETIDKQEADKNPPQERWHELKDLKKTIAIDLICHPLSSQIVDRDTIQKVVDLFQESNYVEVTEYPKREPDVKLYFRKQGGFIMAGRFYIKEGVINSPEGPVIKIDSMAVKLLMDNIDCNADMN